MSQIYNMLSCQVQTTNKSYGKSVYRSQIYKMLTGYGRNIPLLNPRGICLPSTNVQDAVSLGAKKHQ
jgi:hypothetical protein